MSMISGLCHFQSIISAITQRSLDRPYLDTPLAEITLPSMHHCPHLMLIPPDGGHWLAEGEHTQLVLGHCNKTLDLYLLFRFGEVAGGWILLVDIPQWIKKSSVRDDMAMRLSQIYAYSCRVCSLKRVRSVCPNWISDLCKKSAMPEQTGRARHSLTAGISSSTYLYLFLSLSVDF